MAHQNHQQKFLTSKLTIFTADYKQSLFFHNTEAM